MWSSGKTADMLAKMLAAGSKFIRPHVQASKFTAKLNTLTYTCFANKLTENKNSPKHH